MPLHGSAFVGLPLALANTPSGNLGNAVQMDVGVGHQLLENLKDAGLNNRIQNFEQGGSS